MLANRIDGTAPNEDVARGHEYAAFTVENAARMDERDTRVDRRLCGEPRCHEPEHEKAEHPHGHLVFAIIVEFRRTQLELRKGALCCKPFLGVSGRIDVQAVDGKYCTEPSRVFTKPNFERALSRPQIPRWIAREQQAAAPPLDRRP